MSHVPPSVSPRPVPQALHDALQQRFGERCSAALAVRQQHGRDESPFDVDPPELVVFCESTEDVAFVLQQAHAHAVPVIPYGAGSSLEGHLLAVQGGISLDVSRMSRVLQVRENDLSVTVQAGVTREQLNSEIRHTGLFFPLDPGANASIGGMTATRASGTNAVRYGTMRENVLALEVVLPSGELLRTGSRARKSSMGYDLTKLFVGAEGTLGVLTKITLRLHPVPAAISAAVCPFDSLKGAVDTCIATIQSGVPIARIEFLDDIAIAASNHYSKMSHTVAPTLFLEFHGTEAGIREQAEIVEALAAENGGRRFQWATQREERERLWKARHDSNPATRAMRPGAAMFVTDACVPISALADNMTAARADGDASFLKFKINGHVGDGNFHVSYLVMPDAEEEVAEAKRLAENVVMRALESGGTASGEHGVGLGKLKYLRREHGNGIEVMGALKLALDPHEIMNPGKLGMSATL